MNAIAVFTKTNLAKSYIPRVGEAAPKKAWIKVDAVRTTRTFLLTKYSFPNKERMFSGNTNNIIDTGIEKTNSHLLTNL